MSSYHPFEEQAVVVQHQSPEQGAYQEYYHSIDNKHNPFKPQSTAKNQKSSALQDFVSRQAPPDILAQRILSAAQQKSQGRCALYVRRALQAAGYKVTPQPSAYMYADGVLAKAGFRTVSQRNYQPQIGDVVVFNRTPKNPHGHIQVYTQEGWMSDFRQRSMMVYGNNHQGYSIWRDARFMGGASDGTYLALNPE